MLPASLRVAEVVSALSQALDLGFGSTAWHSPALLLGMRIAAELKLPEDARTNLLRFAVEGCWFDRRFNFRL